MPTYSGADARLCQTSWLHGRYMVRETCDKHEQYPHGVLHYAYYVSIQMAPHSGTHARCLQYSLSRRLDQKPDMANLCTDCSWSGSKPTYHAGMLAWGTLPRWALPK